VPVVRSSPTLRSLRDHRAGDVVELTFVRDAHAFMAGRTEPSWFARGTTVTGHLIRVNPTMRRVVVALPTGLATFQEEDVEPI
jgi:hypothetical protein